MAAKKADDDVTLSPIYKQLVELLGKHMPKGDPNDEDVLDKIIETLAKEDSPVPEDKWNEVTSDAEAWIMVATDARNNNEPIPPIPTTAKDIDAVLEPVADTATTRSNWGLSRGM